MLVQFLTHRAYKITGVEKTVVSPLNFGIGTDLKYFFSLSMKGAFYTGGGIEVSWGGSHVDNIENIRSWQQKDVELNVSGNLGYRWILYPSNTIISLGVLPFLSKKLKNEWYDADQPITVYQGDKRWLGGCMLELSIGKQF